MEILLRTIDFETTDKTDPPDNEIVEIGLTDNVFDTDTKESTISAPVGELFAPTKPMKPEVIGVHHITNEMVEGRPVCTDADLRRLVMGEGTPYRPNFIVAHNAEYEARWLPPEMLGDVRLICTFKCALHLFPEGPHTNQGLKYALGLAHLPEDLCFPPHRGPPDSFVTAHVVAAMAKMVTIRQLVTWTLEPRFYATCPIGKHRGQTWDAIPMDYLEWMQRQQDMESDLKAAARNEITARRERAMAHLKPQGETP